MKKTHYRDYATEAFRLYAQEGSLKRYKEKIYRQAIAEATKGHKQKFGSPTEAQVIRAEQALEDVKATLLDLEAVEKTMLRLELSCYGTDKIKVLKIVYMNKGEIQRGVIQERVHYAEIHIPASEAEIYRWLAEARRIFAEERGLRF